MTVPCTKTIDVRVTEHEYSLLEALAELCGMTVSELVRELIGLDRRPLPTRRHLELVPTRRGGRQAVTCLPLLV